jgi:two-component system response regulator YesN
MNPYKVLIVEDEKPASEVFKQMILQRKDFEVIGQAKNGKQGLELCRELQPHFLVTDITMPIMGGIELLLELQKSNVTIPVIIILSCHKDFHYAQQAIRLGADCYLIKDDCLNDDQLLTRTMEEFIPTMVSNKENKQKQIDLEAKVRTNQIELDHNGFLDILRGNESDWSSFLATLEYSNKDKELVIVYIELDQKSIRFHIDESEELKLWKFATVNVLQEFFHPYGVAKVIGLEKGRFITFCSTEHQTYDIPSQLIKTFQTFLKMNCYVHNYKSMKLNCRHELQYIKSLYKESHLFFYEQTQQAQSTSDKVNFEFASIPPEVRSDWIKRLQAVLFHLKFNESNTSIDEWRVFIEQSTYHRWNPQQVKTIYFEALLESRKWQTGDYQDEQSVTAQLSKDIANCQTIEHVQQTVEAHVTQIRRHIQHVNSIDAVLANVLSRIQSDLSTPYSVEEMAGLAGYSVPHFCHLFKKATGQTFIQYVRDLRIERAKFLLLNTNCKTFEIAQNVGMDNYRHFNKIFKRNVEMSPSEFRRYFNK